MYGTITEVCRDYANRELIIDSLISKLEYLLKRLYKAVTTSTNGILTQHSIEMIE